MSFSIVFSTRELDSGFINHIGNTVGLKDVEIISYTNKGEFSLSELYNRGLKESKYNSVVFMHDDVIFNQDNWGQALSKQFQDTNYGILGVAGTTDLIKDNNGIVERWWAVKNRMVGRIRHQSDGKIVNNFYSNRYENPVQVICLDGVFIAVDKRRLQKHFDERFEGFHYYDIAFTFSNHLAGVKVGVVFDIDLTHKSGGKIDKNWHNNQLLFSKIYGNKIPFGLRLNQVDFDSETVEEFNPGESIISIIIPTKDKIEMLIDCVKSIIEHTHIARYEIIIADTGSMELNKKKLKDWIASLDKNSNLFKINVVEYDYYNFSRINNDIVRSHLLKKSNYVLFCNNDIKLLNDAVDRCLSLFKEKRSIGTVGIRLHYPDNSVQHNGMEILFGVGEVMTLTHRNINSYHCYDRGVVEVVGNTAAFMMMERYLFEKYYFNEGYKECFEDVELNLQLLKFGRKNYQVGHAVAYHYESQTRNDSADKLKKLMKDYRNHLLPFFKENCVPLFFYQLFEGASRASKMGHYQTALEICELLLKHALPHPDVYHLLGVIRGRQGDHAGAVQSIRRAIELNGKQPAYHHNLGEALRRQDDPVAAEHSYRQALRLAPQLVETHVSLANVLKDQDRLDEAFSHYQQALRFKPDHASAYYSWGNALLERGSYAEATGCYQRALQLRPDFSEAYNNLGQALDAGNRLEEAAEAFRQALHYKPDLVEARRNLGAVLERQDLIEDARACYRNILEREPDDYLLCLRADSLCPAIPASNLEIDAYRTGLMARLEQLRARSTLQFDVQRLHTSGFEPPLRLAYQGRDDRSLKEAWATLFQSKLPEIESRPLDGKPHIGFVVTRGHEGVFLKGMRGFLNHMSLNHFKVSVICSQQGGEAILRSGIQNVNLRYLPLPVRFDQAVEAIRQARFDILYYWEVGTDSVNYFLPFFRLAPIQCTGWGWPVTSGIPQMDYYLSSLCLEPADGGAHYSERLIRFQRLPTYFYRPEAPEAAMGRGRFGLTTDQHIYLCAQNLRKLHPDFDVLMEGILRRDPRGLVVLIEDAHPAVTAQLRQRQRVNLPEVVDRVRFLARLPYADYLSLLSLADVILDTVHFGGGVTVYEAFSAGKPVVTLPGEFSRGRYAYAAYRQMDLDEGVAASPEDYIERALRFANEPDYRTEFCRQLREASAELFEDRKAMQELEGFFQSVLS